MIKEFFAALFGSSKKEQVNFINIDSYKIRKSLPKNFSSTKEDGVINLSDDTNYFLLDENYKSCSATDFKKILKEHTAKWKLYRKNSYDCDNFAFKLCSNLKTKYPMLSVGIALSPGHAFNVFVDKNGKAWYIEPQTDKVYTYSKLPKLFLPLSLVII